MQLRYLKGDKITVNWSRTSPIKSLEFAPEGEVSEELGLRLLGNEKYKGWFEEIIRPFKCEECGEKFESTAGLGSHKRIHKGETK